ncbi:hypothetical protein DENSPDRAFT_886950 [Dentipellis sp. KUC8613]|nr:hypothetical protein DENSPDRAFT_886950 [Dentipellis sp. KUC8613]
MPPRRVAHASAMSLARRLLCLHHHRRILAHACCPVAPVPFTLVAPTPPSSGPLGRLRAPLPSAHIMAPSCAPPRPFRGPWRPLAACGATSSPLYALTSPPPAVARCCAPVLPSRAPVSPPRASHRSREPLRRLRAPWAVSRPTPRRPPLSCSPLHRYAPRRTVLGPVVSSRTPPRYLLCHRPLSSSWRGPVALARPRVAITRRGSPQRPRAVATHPSVRLLVARGRVLPSRAPSPSPAVTLRRHAR